jgi:hypothetical protein
LYGVIDSGIQEDLNRLFFGNEAGHLMGTLKVLIGLFKTNKDEDFMDIIYRYYFSESGLEFR